MPYYYSVDFTYLINIHSQHILCIACRRFWCLKNHNYGPLKVIEFFVSTAVLSLVVVHVSHQWYLERLQSGIAPELIPLLYVGALKCHARCVIN